MPRTLTYDSKAVRLSRQILEEIHAGTYSAGSSLPVEHDLSHRYRVSRATVRRAVGMLCDQRHLVKLPNKGVLVADPFRQDPGVLQIAFITHALTGDTTPYAAGISLGLTGTRGTLATYTTHANLEQLQPLIEKVLCLRPAGVIITPAEEETFRVSGDIFARSRIPWVTLGETTIRDLACDRVTDITFEHGRLVGRHIVQLGLRNPAMITTSTPQVNAGQVSGIRCELEAAGLRLPDERIFYIDTPHGHMDPPDPCIDIERETARLLADGLDCDILIGGHDYPAVGVLRAVLAAGLRVPDQMRVISGMRCAVEGMTPMKLTTVDIRRQQHGFVAAKLLMRRIEGYDGPPEVHYVNAELVRGETT